MLRVMFVHTLTITLVALAGCNTLPSKEGQRDTPREEQRISEHDFLKDNARRAKIFAESAEKKVLAGSARLTWTKADDRVTDVGWLKDEATDKTLIVRKGTSHEYYGDNVEKIGYSFGCDYTFGPDKAKGYLGRNCGQSKAGVFEGWGTFEEKGRIVFLEFHNGKMNGPALTCECQSNGCPEIANCKEQWYAENALTDIRERKYPLPPDSSFLQPIKTQQRSNLPEPRDKGREALWVEQGKDAVRAKLKDPKSATFRNEFFHRGSDNLPITCGEVNSKNSFGGYGGYQRFVSAGKSDLTYLEEQVADFEVVWNRLCR